MKKIIAAAIIFLGAFSLAHADSLNESFDSLGAHEKFITKAKELDPDNRVSIVQNRLVDRTMRFEFAALYGAVAGGDTYINTTNIGGQIDFHITPKWSIGVRHYESLNELTPQGRALFEEAQKQKELTGIANDVVDITYPVNTTIGTITWYPLYGKLNLFDYTVSQFDLYTVVGYGEVQTNRNSSPTFTAGGGIGFWLSQYFSTRFELRYQNYKDEVYTGERNLDLTTVSFTMGLML